MIDSTTRGRMNQPLASARMSVQTEPAPGERRHGVLAFGDSITNAGGEVQWGVALHSWALWTARGLGVPYTGFAVDGATVQDVVALQLPAFASRSADPHARYDVGCLYIGANDVRDPAWDPAAFATGVDTALDFLAQRCARTLALTVPVGLGVPRAGPSVAQANAAITARAAAHGALVVDLGDFGARNHVMADRVHPTAFGQIAIARRALAVLAADGLTVQTDPALLITYEATRRGRLRNDLSYAYRSGRQHVLAALRRRLRR
jgi:lysophospholipase L1-like esterase